MAFDNAPDLARRFIRDLAAQASRLEASWDKLDDMTRIDALARIESLSHTAAQLQVLATVEQSAA